MRQGAAPPFPPVPRAPHASVRRRDLAARRVGGGGRSSAAASRRGRKACCWRSGHGASPGSPEAHRESPSPWQADFVNPPAAPASRRRWSCGSSARPRREARRRRGSLAVPRHRPRQRRLRRQRRRGGVARRHRRPRPQPAAGRARPRERPRRRRRTRLAHALTVPAPSAGPPASESPAQPADAAPGRAAPIEVDQRPPRWLLPPPPPPPPSPASRRCATCRWRPGVPDLVEGPAAGGAAGRAHGGADGEVQVSFAVDAAGIDAVRGSTGADLLKEAARQAVAVVGVPAHHSPSAWLTSRRCSTTRPTAASASVKPPEAVARKTASRAGRWPSGCGDRERGAPGYSACLRGRLCLPRAAFVLRGVLRSGLLGLRPCALALGSGLGRLSSSPGLYSEPSSSTIAISAPSPLRGPEAQDAGVAAGTAARSARRGVSNSFSRPRGRGSPRDLAARVQLVLVALGQGDELLGVRPQLLGLHSVVRMRSCSNSAVARLRSRRSARRMRPSLRSEHAHASDADASSARRLQAAAPGSCPASCRGRGPCRPGSP